MSVETVLVTGASSGIGRELVRCFASDGCRLILVTRKRQALQALADELREAHKTQSEIFPADLSQPGTPARIFEHLQVNGTKVDVLVNNAGFGAVGDFAGLAVERQLEMVQVNVTAVAHLTRLLLPGMIERHRGGILNVASTASFEPGPGMAVYYATKAFLLSFSEAIAEELAGSGVTVTALCPALRRRISPRQRTLEPRVCSQRPRCPLKWLPESDIAHFGKGALLQSRVFGIGCLRFQSAWLPALLSEKLLSGGTRRAMPQHEKQWLRGRKGDYYGGPGPKRAETVLIFLYDPCPGS